MEERQTSDGQDFTDEIGVLRDQVSSLERVVRSLQAVHAQVNSDGTIAYGNGNISVVRNSAGDYTVTFINPFDAVPLIDLTVGPTSASAGIRLSNVTPPSSSGFRVITFNTTTGSPGDCAFAFAATHA